MSIIVNLDVVLGMRKTTLQELSKKINLSEKELIAFSKGKISQIDVKLLEIICRELDCQPGDLLEFNFDDGE